MGQKLNNVFLVVVLLIANSCFSQDEGVKPPVITEYKGDTTFANFHSLRFDIAKAQIISLKKDGALLVRLKTIWQHRLKEKLLLKTRSSSYLIYKNLSFVLFTFSLPIILIQ
jgi:hypothetical protein